MTAAANKSLWSKVSISIVSVFVGIFLGAQFNIIGSLMVVNFEGRGDTYLDAGIPEQREKLLFSIDNNNDKQLSYLNWRDDTPPAIPSNWSFVKPNFCYTCHSCNQKWLKTGYMKNNNTTEKIIVHYHMQHNAGTNFYALARNFTACATRACWQMHKHCLVSYNEEVEAKNIRRNYHQMGVQYVSYETVLPPRFPLPFVSKSAREGLFFTTIMRDPMKRFVSWLRTIQKFPEYNKNKEGAPSGFFFNEMKGKRGPYQRENLNVRWLSGTLDDVTPDHVNIAKCRLQLFDLVIVDTMYDAAINDVVCPLNNWEGKKLCNSKLARKGEHKSKKLDPLNGTDSHFVGAWIERLRPSFELYDYARILSYLQLKDRGVKNVPDLSEIPSYIEALERYAGVKLKPPKESLVKLKNIKRFHPPKEFCESLKKVWVGNEDEVPNVLGIGTFTDSPKRFNPREKKNSTRKTRATT